MSEGRSDALVFFGATGDLAYKKISPVYGCEPGTSRPKEVDWTVSRPGGWQDPMVRSP